ncbi:MAG: ABC transporter substrate-binding protein [Acutalibacteraceae bacterium]
MKKAIKLVCLALCAVMALGCFAGCGDKKEAENGESAEKTIVIGSTGPLTGDAAVYGMAVKNAAELAVKDVNDSGVLGDIKLEFKMEDDVADAEKAIPAYNKLKDEDMKVFLGTVTTGACLSVIEKTKQDNIFELTPSASAADVVKNDNCFQVCFTDPNQGRVSADYIADNKIASKVAVIYDSSDAYSSGIYNTFRAEAEVKGLELVSEKSFTKDNKTDFSAQIGDAKAKGAELVFLPIYYSEAAQILKQSKSAGYEPKFFGCDGLDGILGIKNFDTSLAEGVMLLTPFAADAKDEATQNFVSSYKAAYNNEVPNQFAADAYDGIKIIAECIKNGKITADMSASEMCEIFKTQITSLSYDGLTGSGMTWKATGEVNKEPKAVKIENGAYVSMQ